MFIIISCHTVERYLCRMCTEHEAITRAASDTCTIRWRGKEEMIFKSIYDALAKWHQTPHHRWTSIDPDTDYRNSRFCNEIPMPIRIGYLGRFEFAHENSRIFMAILCSIQDLHNRIGYGHNSAEQRMERKKNKKLLGERYLPLLLSLVHRVFCFWVNVIAKYSVQHAPVILVSCDIISIGIWI